MPVTDTIGERRTGAVYQILGFLVYWLVLIWTTMNVAVVVALLWAIGNVLYRLILNRELMWGKAWAKSLLVWHYDFLLWTLGLTEWPGWMGWTPANR